MDFARGTYQVDYEQRVDFAALRQGRVRKAQQAMRETGIDAVFLWRDENVRYLTSLRAIMLQYRASTTYGVFLAREGNPILFLSSGELPRARLAMPWIEEFCPIPIMDERGLVEEVVAKKVRPVFEKYEVNRGTVAIDSMSFLQKQCYEKYLPGVEWVDGESLMQRVRRVKLPEEMQLLQEATAIADAVTQTAIDAVHPGARECEIAAEAARTLFRLGGEFGHLASPFVASGERMSPPTRFPTDKIVRHGDLVFIDIGAAWNGYFADVGRTVICGKPSARQKQIYTAVYESLMAGAEFMKPGRRCSEVTEVFRAKAARFGLENHFIDLFIGHGIGCSPAETPFLGETMPGAEDVVLEPGMVLALEPLIWVPGVAGGGGVRIEDMVMVTEEGAVFMSRAPYDERLLD